MKLTENMFIVGGYLLSFLILLITFENHWLIIILLPLFFYIYFYYYRIVKEYNKVHLYMFCLILILGNMILLFL